MTHLPSTTTTWRQNQAQSSRNCTSNSMLATGSHSGLDLLRLLFSLRQSRYHVLGNNMFGHLLWLFVEYFYFFLSTESLPPSCKHLVLSLILRKPCLSPIFPYKCPHTFKQIDVTRTHSLPQGQPKRMMLNHP